MKTLHKFVTIDPVAHRVRLIEREARHRHRGGVLWLTGFSGAGKSTLAAEAERQLFDLGYEAYLMDGDNLRCGLTADLGFSPADRTENIRRVGETAKLFSEAGFIVIAALISPYRADRARARATCGDRFHEIFVNASLATCEQRDPKGLYKKARAGSIPDFTGIDAPYEFPLTPELMIDTEHENPNTCVRQIIAHVTKYFAITRP